MKVGLPYRPPPDAWWWVTIVRLLKHVDSVIEMSAWHPDNEPPPKSIWLDEKELKTWRRAAEAERRRRFERG